MSHRKRDADGAKQAPSDDLTRQMIVAVQKVGPGGGAITMRT